MFIINRRRLFLRLAEKAKYLLINNNSLRFLRIRIINMNKLKMQELSKKLVIISCFCYSDKPNCGGRHRNNNLILVHTFCVQILLKYLF